ncbi:DUF418 domain-containing protein [Streptomyces sp. OF3]|uniref:DUF418 domain-containing protein n=1 Tax=Streptomyces alkaliterrae TaxID=2213162 RepID=A0A7W3WG94_9ACTN|nr:DUF418 domain-containing protein [Streptomyces alkaliterrae]MBB1251822.1 DUF418 domain-containing protein [Streptomyces alkaliterrae]
MNAVNAVSHTPSHTPAHTPAPETTSGAGAGRPRIHSLDALRGFALCGILLVNIPQIVSLAAGPRPGELHPIREALDLLVQHRFFPIFSFLFGLSFVLFYESAAARGANARLILLRRLLALGVLGGLHQLLHPGEALLPYALAGLVVLLPSTWLPRWAVLLAGLAATVAGLILASGGMALIPGLFLLGAATARYGIPDTLQDRGRQLTLLLAITAPTAVAATIWQHRTWLEPIAMKSAAVAGLLAAIAYVCGFLLLLQSPLGRPLKAVFSPLGRMALTNYVGGTLVVVAAAPLLGLSDSMRWAGALALAAGTLTAQAVFSHWWLARHRYGPLEWAWRRVTWWHWSKESRARGSRAHRS